MFNGFFFFSFEKEIEHFIDIMKKRENQLHRDKSEQKQSQKRNHQNEQTGTRRKRNEPEQNSYNAEHNNNTKQIQDNFKKLSKMNFKGGNFSCCKLRNCPTSKGRRQGQR